MGNSIKSDLGQKNKDKLVELISSAGYTSVRQFCDDVGVDQSNLYTNLDGKWKMSLKRMFKIANHLGVPILEIIDIFYPEELAENQNLL